MCRRGMRSGDPRVSPQGIRKDWKAIEIRCVLQNVHTLMWSVSEQKNLPLPIHTNTHLFGDARLLKCGAVRCPHEETKMVGNVQHSRTRRLHNGQPAPGTPFSATGGNNHLSNTCHNET